MSSHFAKSNADTSTQGKVTSQDEQPRQSSRGRSKSPHRSTLQKSPVKLTNTAKSTPTPKKNHCTVNGTPVNHISTLLLREIMRDTHPVDDLSDEVRPFLSTIDYLNTLSDLVLAVPACGAAIHRYKPQGSNKFSMQSQDVLIHHKLQCHTFYIKSFLNPERARPMTLMKN